MSKLLVLVTSPLNLRIVVDLRSAFITVPLIPVPNDRFLQAQIETLDHETISGTIDGECDGILRLDAIGTEDLGGPQDGGEMKGPITTKILETVGEFTLMVPKGASVNVAALCDGDKNNKITADVDQLSLGARLGVVDEDTSGVTLTLEAIKPPSGDLPPQKPVQE